MLSFPKPTVQQFFQTYSITDFAVSKDEKRIIFCANLNGKMNLWALDLPGGFPYLFAHHDESVHSIMFDPKGRFVLAGYDRDGDENYHIYSLPPTGGLPQPLVTGSETDKFYSAELSKDGNRLYYITSAGNPNYLNTRCLHLDSGKDELLYEASGAVTELVAVSENEEAFVYNQAFGNTYVTAFAHLNGEEHSLTPDSSVVQRTFAPVFADNHTVYFLTDYQSDEVYAAKYDLRTKEFSKVVEVAGASFAEQVGS